MRVRLTFNQLVDRIPPNPHCRIAMNALRWGLFCGALYALLRPALLTTLAADDLVNPFGQLYRSGASLTTVIKESAGPVTANGHFNYLGQAIGAFAMFVWLYLIGKIGIHYGTVYAVTKFGVYLLLLIAAGAVLQHLVRLKGRTLSRWRARILVLITIVGLIQIHIPWSNDPVASYPLAGFMTVVVGLSFLLAAFHAMRSWKWPNVILVGALGIVATQYYEFNLFVVMALAPLILDELWLSRGNHRRLGSRTLKSLTMVGPAAIVTAFLYLRNKKFSANYEGTAVTIDSSFLRATRNGLISSLPGSSWDRANEWLTTNMGIQAASLMLALLSAVLIAILWRLDGGPSGHALEPLTSNSRRFWLTNLAMLIYWFGATVTQTSTAKIQREAGGIGQVYNYYAVGVTVVAIVGASLLVFTGTSGTRRRTIRIGLIALALAVGVYQHQINSHVTTQFNEVLVPNANLLNVFHEGRDNTQRCQALEWWKSLGWPTYYVTDMENGLDLAYQMYRGYEFCKN